MSRGPDGFELSSRLEGAMGPKLSFCREIPETTRFIYATLRSTPQTLFAQKIPAALDLQLLSHHDLFIFPKYKN